MRLNGTNNQQYASTLFQRFDDSIYDECFGEALHGSSRIALDMCNEGSRTVPGNHGLFSPTPFTIDCTKRFI